MRRFIQIKLDEKDKEKMLDILNSFSVLCVLKNDPSQAHGFNQRILFNSGVLDDLFDFFEKFYDLYKGYEIVIEGCLDLMRVMTQKNSVISPSILKQSDH